IVVDRANGGGGSVRLNYLVDAASWHPHYKLRAGKPDEPVQIDYLAALVQQTGEDWGHVELTLSTAQPMLNAAPPELAQLEGAAVARAAVPMPPGVAGGDKAPTFASEGKGKDGGEKLASQAKDLRRQAEQLQNSFKEADQRQANWQLNEAAAFEQNLDL